MLHVFASIVRYLFSYQSLEPLQKFWLFPSEAFKGIVLSYCMMKPNSHTYILGLISNSQMPLSINLEWSDDINKLL